MYFTILLLILGLFSNSITAQKIENNGIHRHILKESYFRLSFDNDFFAHSDDNYTQGISLEIADPIFQKNPVNYLFLNYSENKINGISIEQAAFTPEVISSKEIRYGERPFAAALYLKSFQLNINHKKQSVLYSSLSLGVLGPLAYGEEGQVFIHEATGNWVPYGWRNQVNNDVIINYELNHEKKLFELSKFVTVYSDLGLRVGSLFTDASIGYTSTLGVFKSVLNQNQPGKFQLYFYHNPKLIVVGYDASLQGGLFNNSNPYTIPFNDIYKIKAQVDYGLVLKAGFLYLEYTRSFITKEFRTGTLQNWGGIRLGFKF
ncbi:DUF2219 domain-containing protein [Gramella sp. AN32]|nr:DUF2219 domain-containing protein [Gramella sp. AN32]